VVVVKQENAKERIEEAAFSLFNKISFSKTSVDDIAKAADLGKGTIYLYFKSKEDILLSIFEKKIKIYIADNRFYYFDKKINFFEKIIKFVDYYIDELNNIKDVLFGSFDNFSNKVLRDIFLKYSDYDSLEIKFIMEVLKNSKIENIKYPKYIRLIVKEFFRLITGRALLFYLEAKIFNKEKIKKHLKAEAEIIMKSFSLYLKDYDLIDK